MFDLDKTVCGGRYRVRTVSFEMKMSHWVNAPFVERVSDKAVVLDLSRDLWDLWAMRDDGDELLLVMRKYPGITNDVQVGVIQNGERFTLGGKVVTRDQLLDALKAFP